MPIPAPQGEASASGLQVTWTASREFHHTLSCSQLTLGPQEGGGGRLGRGWLFWSQKGAQDSPPGQKRLSCLYWLLVRLRLSGVSEGHLPGGPER